jgi:hypothetical protein
VPQLRDYLPELTVFAGTLADERHSERIANWTHFVDAVREFYTPDQMAKIGRYIPEWSQMALRKKDACVFHPPPRMTLARTSPGPSGQG